MAPGGVEVPGRASRGRNRTGLAFAHRVDMEPVEDGGQDLVWAGLDSHGRIAVREIEGGVTDRSPAGTLQLCCHSLRAGRRGAWRRGGLATAFVGACA